MITGGSEAAITPMAIGGFANMQALSENNENYQHASRPFDKNRDGFVMGEGAGIVILEELEHAKRRGARIYGEVAGYGMTGWYGWYGPYGPYAPYGWNWWGPTTYEVRDRQYNTLTIDMVDPETGALLWRGTGTRHVHLDWKPDTVDKKVRKVVTKMLDNFPPGREDE